MSKLQHISSDDFESEILKSEKPVLLEFGATWCQPCKLLEPVLEQMADEYAGDLRFAKVDVDEASEITINYQVLSVPTTMLFKDGEVIERLVGYQPKEKIAGKISPHLQTA